MDLSWVPAMLSTFQHHHPWIAGKVGDLASQGVKEVWEQIKARLGHPATDKVEAKPEDQTQWELLKAKLLVALDEDPAFAEKLRAAAQRVITQQATGDHNKQAAVSNSTNVKISM